MNNITSLPPKIALFLCFVVTKKCLVKKSNFCPKTYICSKTHWNLVFGPIFKILIQNQSINHLAKSCFGQLLQWLSIIRPNHGLANSSNDIYQWFGQIMFWPPPPMIFEPILQIFFESINHLAKSMIWPILSDECVCGYFSRKMLSFL